MSSAATSSISPTKSEIFGTYDTLSFQILHPGIRHFGRDFAEFDEAAQYVFKYVSPRLEFAKSKKPSDWHNRIQDALNSCEDRIVAEATQLDVFLQSCFDSSPALVSAPAEFAVVVQTVYATQYANLILRLDKYCMLLDAASLRAEISEDEYLKKYYVVKTFLRNVLDVVRKLTSEARSEMLRVNVSSRINKKPGDPVTKKKRAPRQSKSGPVEIIIPKDESLVLTTSG